MDLDELRKCFEEKKSQHNITFQLKNEQLMIGLSIAQGKNCLGFLPTGFGKTMCFVLNSIVSDTETITLIVSPLLSLMDN
jgi:ATP-dependent DNA helicase RecQ